MIANLSAETLALKPCLAIEGLALFVGVRAATYIAHGNKFFQRPDPILTCRRYLSPSP